jgi:hypothetical protein
LMSAQDCHSHDSHFSGSITWPKLELDEKRCSGVARDAPLAPESHRLSYTRQRW